VDELLPSGGLGSDIATGGQPLQPYNGGEGGVGRLAQLHARSRLSQADRQVASGYDALEQLADLLDLPQNIRVIIFCFFIFKNNADARVNSSVYLVVRSKRTRCTRCLRRSGRRFKQNVVETAVIYVACKEAGVPRTFRELARSTGLREKHIRKYYGLVRKVVVPKTDQAIAPTTAADLVVRATRHTTRHQ
jgi:transcription initiation factor TFIIIB Brf1 subunit/transcription initiation factor TFIIB